MTRPGQPAPPAGSSPQPPEDRAEHRGTPTDPKASGRIVARLPRGSAARRWGGHFLAQRKREHRSSNVVELWDGPIKWMQRRPSVWVAYLGCGLTIASVLAFIVWGLLQLAGAYHNQMLPRDTPPAP